jgi:hypothetical protein
MAASLAYLWLRFGPLESIVGLVPLAVVLGGTDMILQRLWVRGWERCRWIPPERDNSAALDVARRGRFIVAGIVFGFFLVLLGGTAWMSRPDSQIGAPLGLVGVLMAVGFGRKLVRLSEDASQHRND